MDFSKNSHVKDVFAKRAMVWYEGTDAITEGEAVCFNTDYGTAASADGRRSSYVERPSTSNNQAFAGVVARDYVAKTTGQFIEINLPGSKGVNIKLGASATTTINQGFLTFTASTGTDNALFARAGFEGQGSAYIRQTQATAGGKCMADLMEGPQSGGVEFITLDAAGGSDVPYMVGGVSFVGLGGVTLAADAECELANGLNYGERKAFVCLGTLTTSDFVVDLVAAGIQLDGSALAEVNAIDAAGDGVTLEWNGIWRVIGLTGGATQA
jgi:hypothetical protein